ncbi:hypothetical protein L1987_34721 [Smallanthus sonchifolius]|uniref:Uncharacterized protein n=1 Tax=Smallanthus sonchifolius TaxID=185202 RepID=A0ACB9HVF5_9ASTR|nr:hypothetical protein L1987_34721 [Smallanthus sonchifolius]
MEKDAIPVAPTGANTKPVTGSRWNRNLIELHGRSERNYIHKVSPLLMKSYAEERTFSIIIHIKLLHSAFAYITKQTHYLRNIMHEYDEELIRELGEGRKAQTLNGQNLATIGVLLPITGGQRLRTSLTLSFLQTSLFRVGIAALEFEPEGTYLASVTRSGCFTVHEFESLYGPCIEPVCPVYQSAEVETRNSWSVITVSPGSFIFILNCHYCCSVSKRPGETVERKQSVYVPLSKRVTACAIHPLNDTIVAGTMEASLLTISQKHLCKNGDDDDDDDEHS